MASLNLSITKDALIDRAKGDFPDRVTAYNAEYDALHNAVGESPLGLKQIVRWFKTKPVEREYYTQRATPFVWVNVERLPQVRDSQKRNDLYDATIEFHVVAVDNDRMKVNQRDPAINGVRADDIVEMTVEETLEVKLEGYGACIAKIFQQISRGRERLKLWNGDDAGVVLSYVDLEYSPTFTPDQDQGGGLMREAKVIYLARLHEK